MRIIQVQLIKNNFELNNQPDIDIEVQTNIRVLNQKNKIELGEGVSKIILNSNGYTMKNSDKISIFDIELEMTIKYLILSEEKKKYTPQEFSNELLKKISNEILEPLNYNLVKCGIGELDASAIIS